jgi:hypothetical protein
MLAYNKVGSYMVSVLDTAVDLHAEADTLPCSENACLCGFTSNQPLSSLLPNS